MSRTLFLGPTPKFEMLRPEYPLRCDVSLVRLSQQPGDHAIGHQRSRLPAIRLQRRVEMGELRLESRLSSPR
jgi:hypothetical protein